MRDAPRRPRRDGDAGRERAHLESALRGPDPDDSEPRDLLAKRGVEPPGQHARREAGAVEHGHDDLDVPAQDRVGGHDGGPLRGRPAPLARRLVAREPHAKVRENPFVQDRRALVLAREEAPVLERVERPVAAERQRHSLERRARLLPAEAHGDGETDLRIGDLDARERADAVERRVVEDRPLLPAPLQRPRQRVARLEALPDDLHAREEVVRLEALRDVSLDAAAERDHGDEHAHADDHAERREHASQLGAPEVLEREMEQVAEDHEPPCARRISSTIRPS